MIAKIVRGNGFKGLASYLTKQEGARVLAAENLPSEDPRRVARVMRTTANRSTRCKKPVYHLSLRLAPGDRALSDEEWLSIGGKVRESLGVKEHQALIVKHGDDEKGEGHVHMMIDRVHPVTGKAAALKNDYKAVESTLRKIEGEYGLEAVEPSQIVKRRDQVGRDTQKERRERKRRGRTHTDKHKEAVKRAWAQGDQALTLDDFQAALHKQGFMLARGDSRGFVIVDKSGRVCSFSRTLSKKKRDELGVRLQDRPQYSSIAEAQKRLNRELPDKRPRPHMRNAYETQKQHDDRMQNEYDRRQTQRAKGKGAAGRELRKAGSRARKLARYVEELTD